MKFPCLICKYIEWIDLQGGRSLIFFYIWTKIYHIRYYRKNEKINKIESVDNFNDLNGLTSLIDICDFVITVSNTNAHISGALGKKTYLLLPKGKGKLWYWSSEKNKSVWYNSIRIIEQKTADIWGESINKLKKGEQNERGPSACGSK